MCRAFLFSMNIHGLEFHNRLNVTPLPNGKDWEFSGWYAVTFYIDLDPQKYLIFIPKYYVTDFGSIPRLAWFVVGSPATGKHRRGTVFHDWVFTMHSKGIDFANALFDAIMTYDKTPAWKKYLINLAVNTGGRISWLRWHEKRLVPRYKRLHDEQLKDLNQFYDCKVYA